MREEAFSDDYFSTIIIRSETYRAASIHGLAENALFLFDGDCTHTDPFPVICCSRSPPPLLFLLAWFAHIQSVRREGMVLIKSLATLKPHILRLILPTVMPIILAETAVKQDLRRLVQMGPFKESPCSCVHRGACVRIAKE